MIEMCGVEGLGLRFLKRVPEVVLAFGYGSGVFLQPDLYHGEEKPQVDFVFGVKDPFVWHAEVILSKLVQIRGANVSECLEFEDESRSLFWLGTLWTQICDIKTVLVFE